VSSSAIEASTIPALVDHCRASQLRRVELTSSMPYQEEIAEQLAGARQWGMRWLLHNYFPPPRDGFVINLASADPAIRRRSIEHCRAALELSAAISAPFYSVHAGFTTDPRPTDLGGRFEPGTGRGLVDAARMFYESVAQLCETAERLGVNLLIENNVVTAPNAIDGRNDLFLCVSGDDVEALFTAVRSPSLGILLDVAHLKVSAATLNLSRDRALEQMRPHVRAFHLSDNDGLRDDNQPFGRDAWFVPQLSRSPHAQFVIETTPLDATTLAGCLSVVENAL
jgi:sugar phosphate isomerase/epimerase